MREQGIVLEDHADLALFRRQRAVGQADGLALQLDLAMADGQKTGQGPENGAFAATTGAKQATDIAVAEGKADVPHHGIAAVTTGQVVHFQ